MQVNSTLFLTMRAFSGEHLCNGTVSIRLSVRLSVCLSVPSIESSSDVLAAARAPAADID